MQSAPFQRYWKWTKYVIRQQPSPRALLLADFCPFFCPFSVLSCPLYRTTVYHKKSANLPLALPPPPQTLPMTSITLVAASIFLLLVGTAPTASSFLLSPLTLSPASSSRTKLSVAEAGVDVKDLLYQEQENLIIQRGELEEGFFSNAKPLEASVVNVRGAGEFVSIFSSAAFFASYLKRIHTSSYHMMCHNILQARQADLVNLLHPTRQAPR